MRVKVLCQGQICQCLRYGHSLGQSAFVTHNVLDTHYIVIFSIRFGHLSDSPIKICYYHLFQDLVETMMETRKKSMDYCQFPGFRHGELIELPAQLESPPILHRVTKAQNFNVCTESSETWSGFLGGGEKISLKFEITFI